MERYDAAIIGAGPDGLVAAQMLARAGLRVVVLERDATTGGRAVTREFFPGFRASPFLDELAPIPAPLFWSLDAARHGALLMPAPGSVCVSARGTHVLPADERRPASTADPASGALAGFRRELATLRRAMAERALSPGEALGKNAAPAWPGEAFGAYSLEEALSTRFREQNVRLHLAAAATSGRAASPFLSGTAVHLLAMGGSGVPAGGLGGFAAALDLTARGAGASVRCDSDVVDIRVVQGRATAVILGSGEEIAARAVLSALDVKRTFLNLIAWKHLPETLVRRVAQFRTAAASARVLFALDTVPEFGFAREDPEAARAPIHVLDNLDALARTHEAWRAGRLGDRIPATLRVPSLADPSLAPAGKSVMTVTLSGVPARLVDGEWIASRREMLINRAVAAAEQVLPRIGDRVLACATIAAPDIEQALGLTDGDLDGGEVAPDQIFGFRPFGDWPEARTPITGLYLAGPSAAPSPFLFGVSAVRAANALLLDYKSGRLA